MVTRLGDSSTVTENRWEERKITTILFDIDGTLYSNLVMFVSAPFVYARNILWIIRFAKMRKKLRGMIEKQRRDDDVLIKDDSLRDASIGLFAKEVGCSETEASILLEEKIYRLWIDAIKKVPLRCGMRHILGTLKRKGFKLGIVSDFKSVEKIQNWGIETYFDVIVCAENYGTLKPDVRIFRLACELLHSEPEESIFVGNHLEYDGKGAIAARLLLCLLFQKRRRSYLNIESTLFFKSMFGFKRAISKILGERL